jgi:hypothetical protein
MFNFKIKAIFSKIVIFTIMKIRINSVGSEPSVVAEQPYRRLSEAKELMGGPGGAAPGGVQGRSPENFPK